ncbi:hypothetical protein [Herbaspirillum sp.]|uniref:hypothetical protein n=1 Tax=Herbaspirillum sp. TaxID=1890675 RepID=UPI0031E402BC
MLRDAMRASIAPPMTVQNGEKKGLFLKIFAGEKACSGFFTNSLGAGFPLYGKRCRAMHFPSK